MATAVAPEECPRPVLSGTNMAILYTLDGKSGVLPCLTLCSLARKMCFVLLVTLVVCGQASTAMGAAPIHYTLAENSPAGTSLGNVLADSNLTRRYAADILETFEFSMLKGTYMQHFTLVKENAATGPSLLLKTTYKLLDRDELCSKDESDCRVSVDIALSEPINYFQVIKAIVSITDVNDNSPTFPVNETKLVISESAAVGVSFVLPAAADPDTGVNGRVTYRLETDDADEQREFHLVADTGMMGDEVKLLLQRPVDRETRSRYSFRIIASDAGSPPRQNTLGLTIEVTDTNDNYPEFLEPIYNTSITEDFPTGVPILTVSAIDPDHGPNGKVVYEFTAQTISAFGKTFHVDSSKGEIILLKEVDYEKRQTYHLVVTAHDLGPNAISAYVKVIVNIMDVNDFVPQITLNILKSDDGIAIVKENQTPGHFVAHLSVEDQDLGPSGQVSCHLIGINQYMFDIRHLFQNEYKIITNGTFDRETQAEYDVIIQCTDHGKRPLHTQQHLKVKVMDENDHPPVFSKSIYHFRVKENASFPHPISRIYATDEDIGDNGRLSYFLQQSPDNPDTTKEPVLIQVDRESGTISTNGKFDYETETQHVFIVLVADGGSPTYTATATVIVNVTDINDQSPTFHQAYYSFGTYENQPAGTEIGSVSASDMDTVPYDEIEYSIAPGSKWRGVFSIGSTSGKIETRRVLDREHNAVYNLVVMAKNIAPPYLSASMAVQIQVADKNDNAPAIMYPTKDNNSVQVSVHAPRGFIIATIDAFDADLGNNARLEFVMAKGNEEELFEVTPTSGEVMVKADSLLDTKISQYTLLVIIKDHGIKQKSAMATLHVVLNASIDATGLHLETDPSAHGAHGDATEGVALQETIVIIVGVLAAVLAMGLAGVLGYLCRHPRRRRSPAHTPAVNKTIEYTDIYRPAGLGPGAGGGRQSDRSCSSSGHSSMSSQCSSNSSSLPRPAGGGSRRPLWPGSPRRQPGGEVGSVPEEEEEEAPATLGHTRPHTLSLDRPLPPYTQPPSWDVSVTDSGRGSYTDASSGGHSDPDTSHTLIEHSLGGAPSTASGGSLYSYPIKHSLGGGTGNTTNTNSRPPPPPVPVRSLRPGSLLQEEIIIIEDPEPRSSSPIPKCTCSPCGSDTETYGFPQPTRRQKQAPQFLDAHYSALELKPISGKPRGSNLGLDKSRTGGGMPQSATSAHNTLGARGQVTANPFIDNLHGGVKGVTLPKRSSSLHNKKDSEKADMREKDLGLSSDHVELPKRCKRKSLSEGSDHASDTDDSVESVLERTVIHMPPSEPVSGAETHTPATNCPSTQIPNPQSPNLQNLNFYNTSIQSVA